MSTTETTTEKKTDEVSIEVNRKSVSVPKHTTGTEIKSRAGVPATFQLFRITGDKKEHPVGDDEKVTVHKGERFVASPSLDPS